VLCWSLGGVFAANLFIFQCTFTLCLSLWVGYKIVYNKRQIEYFYIVLGQKREQLSHYSELLTGGEPSGGAAVSEIDAVSEELNKTDPVVSYTISLRSRYTQLCIFLFLQRCQPPKKNKSASLHPFKGDELANEKRIVSPKLLFKWQVSERDYRALTSAVLQSTK
jgi:hypothetical protein